MHCILSQSSALKRLSRQELGRVSIVGPFWFLFILIQIGMEVFFTLIIVCCGWLHARVAPLVFFANMISKSGLV